MSTEHTRIDKHALTLEQHRKLNLARPFTDHAIGGLTAGKRDIDALSSALFDQGDSPLQPGYKAPPPPPEPPRRDRRKKAA